MRGGTCPARGTGDRPPKSPSLENHLLYFVPPLSSTISTQSVVNVATCKPSVRQKRCDPPSLVLDRLLLFLIRQLPRSLQRYSLSLPPNHIPPPHHLPPPPPLCGCRGVHPPISSFVSPYFQHEIRTSSLSSTRSFFILYTSVFYVCSRNRRT